MPDVGKGSLVSGSSIPFFFFMNPNYSLLCSLLCSGDECVEETVYWSKFIIPKSKEWSGCKNKGFLTISCNYNEHK